MEEKKLWQELLGHLGSEGDPIPLLTETTIPKYLSSFPSVFAGHYPATPTDTYKQDPRISLISPRDRRGIQWIANHLKENQRLPSTFGGFATGLFVGSPYFATHDGTTNNINSESSLNFLAKV